MVCRSQTFFAIYHKHNNICKFHRSHSLLSHLREDYIARICFYTTSIDNSELPAVPFSLCVDSVACNSRGILNDGFSFSNYSIKKCRFSYVRSTYNCEYRFTHRKYLLQIPLGQIPLGREFPHLLL